MGIDYALFIVTRHRQGLIAGQDIEDSIVNAVNTSGRAVLFAGIIVCIALLGMFALGVSFLYGLAMAAAIGVAFTMVAALTLLPAMLGFIGPRVLSRKQKTGAGNHRPPGRRRRHQGVLAAVGRFHQAPTHAPGPRGPRRDRPHRPAVLLPAARPLRSGQRPDRHHHPHGLRLPRRRLRSGLQRSAAAGHRELGSSRHGQSRSSVADAVRGQADVARVATPVPLPERDGRTVSLITVYPSSSPQAASTTDLVDHLRTSTIPAAVAGSGVEVYVGGNTASFIDFSRVLTSKLPLFIGLVVALSFLLLAVVFRSLVIPLTAAAMNLLSIGAAFGVMVAVFQWGWAGGLIGSSRPGPIDSWLPVMMFAILFGLSMDYEVFLVSRIQRGMAPLRRQPHRRPQRPGGDGQDHHRRRAHHDPRLWLVHPGRDPGHQGIRTGPVRPASSWTR